MTNILFPPVLREIDGPLVFLGGPISGAANWQAKALALLNGRVPNIASPRAVDGLSGRVEGFTEQDYLDQVDWERIHLDQAYDNGVIMFWLENESLHIPERAYAQTSRWELSKRIALAMDDFDARIVVGIDDKFPGGRYMRGEIEKDTPQVPIFSSLEETCEEVANVIANRCWEVCSCGAPCYSRLESNPRCKGQHLHSPYNKDEHVWISTES